MTKMPLAKTSILVIDDDAGMLRALEKVLTGEGASVTAANSLQQALELMGRGQARTDLIITDLRIPGENGATILETVMAAFPQAPVIVITAVGNSQVQAECLARGAAAFLEKPLDTPQLLSAIGWALNGQPMGFPAMPSGAPAYESPRPIAGR